MPAQGASGKIWDLPLKERLQVCAPRNVKYADLDKDPAVAISRIGCPWAGLRRAPARVIEVRTGDTAAGFSRFPPAAHADYCNLRHTKKCFTSCRADRKVGTVTIRSHGQLVLHRLLSFLYLTP